MNQHKPYTKIQLKFIYKNRTLPHARLAVVFNRRFGTKKSRDQLHSLCTRKKWHTGRTGCFEKGHVSWNKDTKGLTSANVTSFKKGNTPKNWLPVGSEIIDSGGYIMVKIAKPNIWEFKHLIIWEAAHGKSLGKPVIFKDGNRLNCELENLEMISRQILLYLNRNRYSELTEELKPSMLAVAKVEYKVFALING